MTKANATCESEANQSHDEPGLMSCELSVFRRPAEIGAVKSACLAGVDVACFDATALSRDNLFDVGFDEVLAGLTRLARTDAEPDGFFVRTGGAEGREWRINGQLYELNERLWRVDLRGSCSIVAFDEMLSLLGWPQVPVVYQMVQAGVTLAEEGFRSWSSGCLGPALRGAPSERMRDVSPLGARHPGPTPGTQSQFLAKTKR